VTSGGTWGVPDSSALHRLALDLIEKAIDAERRHALASWNQGPYITRHFAGDALQRQLRETAWALTRSDMRLRPGAVTAQQSDVPLTSAVKATLDAASWEALVVQRRFDPSARSGRELYDIPRVAVMLDVRESFVRRLVAQRRIPFLKIGKFIRFDPDEIGRWLDHRRAEVLR